MKIKICMASMSLALIVGCADVDTQDVSSSARSSNVPTTEETSGVVVGEFKTSRTDTQTLVASDNSEIQDVALNVAPGALAVDTNITLGEGSDEGSALPDDLGYETSTAIVGGSAPIYFDNDSSVNPAGTLTLEIPIPIDADQEGANLNLVANTGKVGLQYLYRDTDGGHKAGLLILGVDDIVGAFVKAKVGGFGWFRLVFLSEAVESKEVETEEEPSAAK